MGQQVISDKDLPGMSINPEKKNFEISDAQAELTESRIPLKVIHLNRCPVVLPVSMVDAEVEKRTGLNRQLCEQHWHKLHQLGDLTAKLQQVFVQPESANKEYDPDLMLYSGGFFGPQDKDQMEIVRQTPAEQLGELTLAFRDSRLDEMFFRYRARNYRDYLSGDEQQRWDEYRWQRINDASVSNMTPQHFNQRLVELSQTELTPRDQNILEDLVLYVESLVPSHLF